MLDTKDRDLLVEISVMYYLEGKTQTEISKELYMSRPKVSRLLKKARELNIVDIKINYESDDINRITKQVQQRFGVENVVVVKTLSNEDDTIKEIGRAAANELKYFLKDGTKIGMSWGRTVRAMVDAFKAKSLKNMKIIELFGAVEYGEESQEFLSIGYEFSQKVNGTFFSLPSPLYINDITTRNILLDNPIIKNTLKMIDECDLIVTSLGVVNTELPQRIWDAHIDDTTRKELLDKGAQGYLCAHFFNDKGQFIDHAINDNIIGIKTNTIRNQTIMLVAGGESKCKAIHSILRGGYINTLVSDDKTLKQILTHDKKLRGEYQ
jgi:DNA-binding transcriptional regulator LsrR (DeoR family)